MGNAAAPEHAAALVHVYFVRPLAIEIAGLHIDCVVSAHQFEVQSGTLGASGASLVDVSEHCAGKLAAVSSIRWQREDHVSVRCTECAHASLPSGLYDQFDALGLQYGPSYRVLARTWSGYRCGSASALLRPRVARQGMRVHPADLDGAQGIALALDKLPMAFSVELALLQSVAGKLWVRHALRDAHRATACYYSLHYLLHWECRRN